MRKQSWTKRDPIKNYFPLPNEIYDLGLSRGAISVYSFLLRREDRKTYQCLLSYREIGEGVGMCVTTVRKYVAELEERSLIRTERTTVTTKDGRKRNGRLLYHILPIQLAIDQYYERQMDMHLVDSQNLLKEEISLASFTAGFKLAWGLSKELEADGLYSFDEDETERVCRRMEQEEGSR